MAAKKKSKWSVSGRAWRLLRLALLWARKGGAFKRGLMLDLRMLFKGIGGSETRRHYLERELSFDESPAFNFKMRRPASIRLPKIPCITPAVDFENDDEKDWICEKRRDLFRSEEDEEGEEEELDCEVVEEAEEAVEEERGIDSKAEEFIARFYEELKFQRQVSFVEYNEMLRRGMSRS